MNVITQMPRPKGTGNKRNGKIKYTKLSAHAHGGMFACVCVCACENAYIHTYTDADIHAYIPTYIHSYINTYTHAYIYTYIRTHMNTCVCVCVRKTYSHSRKGRI